MSTEIAISFNALRTQLENEKNSLNKIDESIKKIVQTNRIINERYNNPPGEQTRGGPKFNNRSYNASSEIQYKNEDLLGKRKHETKTVFSRLSARAGSEDEEEGAAKRSRVSSTVRREVPAREEVLRAQARDPQALTRNKRIFGALLGTLQKFKQEEIVLQTKEDKKAQVERKIEEQARLQKEKEIQERKLLFADREQKKSSIKALEAKITRVQEFEKWESAQKLLGNFILTKAKPHVYWLPAHMSDKARDKLMSSRRYLEKCMLKKKQELLDELERIEHRVLGMRPPASKENRPERARRPDPHSGAPDQPEGHKRNKFAMDLEEEDKEGSDADDKHEVFVKEEPTKQDLSAVVNGKDQELKEASDAKETTEEVKDCVGAAGPPETLSPHAAQEVQGS